jgi:hypothetical protein
MNGLDYAGHKDFASVTAEVIEVYRKSIGKLAMKSVEA